MDAINAARTLLASEVSRLTHLTTIVHPTADEQYLIFITKFWITIYQERLDALG